ncbi:polysaccharide deacetylase family protein [Streptomyces cocklensis]|jgi:peptidoglycan/xylan/chitin deacetylase (PgdA/CDA1 family)|uniref:Peptidoglycan/xylan/chitin deacetylase, PgdA/CDA1 family n=1 Tax=Actinacidiphila cocklensis TaxID=887465 RepID=A0A9W4DK91_9ACTN|nr:polysaccharide deacetylase family protein [Actinacidiphila cocklensis]MDD1060963.1 polysaccharide deacetylase family protein [Actinacidiphila cocklensis]WSX77289.1 polysaccharide deacetylase family protein [Streptomyces sp. NBC_00899]CAG6391540.1 Peptidoglycan/xylan/chitin deacetylase, PgdA/CDA1 family [Actinacidiphila cocklensis]
MRTPRGTVLLLLGLLLTAGCSTGTPTGSPAPRGTATASSPPSPESSPTDDRAAAFRKWGLPLLPPPPAPPAVKPIRTGNGQIPVVSDIPTDQKIVFLTFDDGAEKDPKFVAMMRDLKIPFTMFLTDDVIKSDYGFFRPLQALGNSIQNHTLSHPDLHGRTLAQQKHEICFQQQKLTQEYGTAPGLFRPPYGNYNADTKAAVKSCGGLRAMILWRESMQIKKVQFQRPDKKFHPGDIILAHFRGPTQLKGESMTVMTANLLRQVASQGFTLARLDDYV